MPRDGNGDYTLPEPSFVPGTTILSGSVNDDLNDIATALSGSVAADGQTPIVGAMRITAGSIAAPSWTFINDVASGVFLPAVGKLGLVAGAFGIYINSAAFEVSAGVPSAAGSNYAVGDTIVLAGGTAVRAAVLTVASLTGSGVASVTIDDPGLYSTAPTNPAAQASTSGSGSGATFSLTTVTADAITDNTGVALWELLGASSYMAGAMNLLNGLDLANYIGAANIAAAVQSSLPIVAPQGRLTLTSNTPVIVADTTNTSVFWTPADNGNLIPIWKSTFFLMNAVSQLTMSLVPANHLANTIYDFFAAIDPATSSTVIIGTGPAWANSGEGTGDRGSGAGTTALTRQSGLLVNANAITLRNGSNSYNIGAKQATYLGSGLIDGTPGQITCNVSFGQSRKWGVWNAFNRIPILLQAGDPSASWTYNVATIRASNAAITNSLLTFCGLAEEKADIAFLQECIFQNSTGNATLQASNMGIGLNSSVAAFVGVVGTFGINGAPTGPDSNIAALMPTARYTQLPAIGINRFMCLEKGNATASTISTFNGTSVNMLLTAQWNG